MVRHSQSRAGTRAQPATAEPNRATLEAAAQSGIDSGPASAEASDVMPVDDIIAAYEGQWILLEVTAFDGGWPSHGRIIARADSRDALDEQHLELIQANRAVDAGSRKVYSVFDAYPLLRTGVEVRAALEELIHSGVDLDQFSLRSR